MAYSLFLKVTMEGDHSENSLMTLARKWAQYIMRINANEGLTEKQLVNVFMNRMGEFYESKGIRLMEENEIEDFMRLLKNLRGGITQIVKRHAKVDIGGEALPPPAVTILPPTLTTQSKQRQAVKAFTTSTPTTCTEEPCIE